MKWRFISKPAITLLKPFFAILGTTQLQPFFVQSPSHFPSAENRLLGVRSMNKSTLFALVAGIVTMISCGSSQNVNGGWNAQVLNPDGSTAFAFFADLKQSGGTVSVSNFGPGPTGTIASCFGTSALNATANFSGGHFAMTVSTLFPAATNNTFTLQGVQHSNGSITGTWTSSGQPSCAATGNFLMTGVPPV